MEYGTIKAVGKVDPVKVAPGETVSIGSKSYTAPANVSLWVKKTKGGYCLKAIGTTESTGVRCYTRTEDPRVSTGHPPPSSSQG
jgi:hypothetical protein